MGCRRARVAGELQRIEVRGKGEGTRSGDTGLKYGGKI